MWLLLALLLPIGACADYQFAGKHFIASYLDCDTCSLGDVESLKTAMREAVLASGATLLSEDHVVFEPNGLTMVFLLSESHASIHTYPEHGACFVDLFTCGNHCDARNFHNHLCEYLKPETSNIRLLARNEEIAELSVDGYHPPHL